MAVFFLADVHLSQKTPAITKAFRQTLHRLIALRPEAVFILGDLFDAWLGDTLADEFARQIATDIQALSNICPVFFQRGNRDFLLGAQYSERSGMTLLPDIYSFEYAGKKLLLTHGDLLCTDDIGYQRLRRIVRHRYFYALAKRIPHAFARNIAHYLRRQSRESNAQKSAAIMDITPKALDELLQRYPVDYLIHGHTHRPAVHTINSAQTRITLGDWRPEGEMLILEMKEGCLYSQFVFPSGISA